MLKSFEIFRISFERNEDGLIEKKYEGIRQPKDYEDIEMGLGSVIAFFLHQKQLPPSSCNCDCKEESLFTIIFKKTAMKQYVVETLAVKVELHDLENILSGLMFMQVKLHMDKMTKKKIKFTLKHDDSVGMIDFTTQEQLV